MFIAYLSFLHIIVPISGFIVNKPVSIKSVQLPVLKLTTITSPSATTQYTRLFASNKYDDIQRNFIPDMSNKCRREILKDIGITAATCFTTFPSLANAVETDTVTTTTTTTIIENTVPMKNFVDPKGLFALRVPQNFYTLRRTVKGDLPDAKTGKGRRGSSIFTAGDMAKAEVVAVELFPTRSLLEEEGYDASGDLSTFSKLGKPEFIANLLSLKREKEKAGSPGKSKTDIVPNSVVLSDDEKTLYFELRTNVDVQKPELLMEQMGVSELVRITLGKADLNSNNGQMMVCYASALDIDFNGADGPALKEVINSFVVMEQKED